MLQRLFCEVHRRENRIKNGGSATRLNSMICWDISQLKYLVRYKESGDALETKYNNV